MIGQLCRRFALILAVFAVLPAAPAFAIANVRDSQQGLPDLDARTGSVVPTAAQKQLASSLGAHATWNRFGTPQSLIKYGGYLATGLSQRSGRGGQDLHLEQQGALPALGLRASRTSSSPTTRRSSARADTP